VLVKTVRAVLAAVVLATGLGACGADPQTEITEVFKGYHTAVLARDYPAVCAYNAPEATERLLASVAREGVRADTCEEALTAVFEQSGGAETADGVARSAEIDEITVDGDRATVRWTATIEGEPMPTSWGLRRIDGAWKLVPAG
jgi:hypothetical protein